MSSGWIFEQLESSMQAKSQLFVRGLTGSKSEPTLYRSPWCVSGPERSSLELRRVGERSFGGITEGQQNYWHGET